jgi:hypothetical protein
LSFGTSIERVLLDKVLSAADHRFSGLCAESEKGRRGGVVTEGTLRRFIRCEIKSVCRQRHA